jgi:hypothetical protein
MLTTFSMPIFPPARSCGESAAGVLTPQAESPLHLPISPPGQKSTIGSAVTNHLNKTNTIKNGYDPFDGTSEITNNLLLSMKS